MRKVLLITLLSVTLLSGLILSSSSTKADSNKSAYASVTVASACTFDGIEEIAHTATIPAGTYKDDIGKTTFSVVCNDTEGYSIYAVGYTNNEFGNNKLLANIDGILSPTYDISTGTNTSSTPSSWAMKITPSTGLTSSNILNNYGSYNVVPSTYTKIVSLVPATNIATNNTSSFEATYAANIAGTQPAGTYQGKVKYTMVHPATNVPNEPKDCASNKICYWPNAEGTVTDAMGDQTMTGYTNIVKNFTTPLSPDSEATLWASNFKRPGYGFIGWSDKFDWVVNENDANGNGTGANEGYHIYGPNQTIVTPSDLNTKGLSLYAVWVKSQGSLQDWSGCGVMRIGEVTALTDRRDNDTYAVARLKDGKCWMVENLRLGGTSPITLDFTTTDIEYGTTFVLSASQDPTQNSWDYAGIDQSMLNSTNTTNTMSNMNDSSLDVMQTNKVGIYSYGNYYNWYSITGGAGTSSVKNSNVYSSICPTGWRLPTGNNDGEFNLLHSAMVGIGEYQSSAVVSNFWRTYPNNFLYSSRIDGSYFYELDLGDLFGSYWSSTAEVSSAYCLFLDSVSSYFGLSTSFRVNGSTARCIYGEPQEIEPPGPGF